MDTLNIHMIIDGCRVNNQKARELLFRQIYPFALPVAMRYSRNDEDANELIEQCYFEVLDSLPAYDARQLNFRTWVKNRIISKALDLLKEKPGNGIDESLPATGKLSGQLLSGIRQLPPVQQAVFSLYAVDGYSHPEIAVTFGITPNESQRLYHDACRLLKVRSMDPSVPIKLEKFPAIAGAEDALWQRLSIDVKSRYPEEGAEFMPVRATAPEMIGNGAWIGWALLILLSASSIILLNNKGILRPANIPVKNAPLSHK
ncbi:RNA polymerase sigma factor [Flavihumibacter profundi]|uniref:RNA polymerase sigma factor n=1 Tax=Flavihumibacter profundi TaxID=2716883 RepID=UPI001CC669A4|nr:sigma-70 family RNA polymerase sigma factor [Flavihumibacter profundi]MBZ5857206.1 sigma-70 family RNA polymerase sigma factor [Flavihumibacter profundi]